MFTSNTSMFTTSTETQFLVAAVLFSFYKRYNIYYVLLMMSFYRTYMWKLLTILAVHTIVYIVSSPKHMIRKKLFNVIIQFIGMMSIYIFV
jgi:hypothetical protein